MKHFGNIIRYTANTLFILSVVVAIAVYVLIHFGLAAKITRETVTPLLCEKLQTQVELGEVEITWLNQLALNDVVIYDQQNDTLLYVRRVMVAYEMVPLLKKQLIINTIQLIEFDTRIRQENAESEPNFKFIVDALAPKTDQKRKFINDFSLHALHLRRGRLSFRFGNDMQELPFPNYRNLQLSDITASMQVEVSHLTGIDIIAKRIGFKEDAGLYMEGSGRMLNDSLHFECTQLALDCALPAQASVQVIADLSLNCPKEVAYQFSIENADISSSAIRRISSTFEISLPQIAELWSDSLGQIQISGNGNGNGIRRIEFDGEIKTQGRIVTQTKVQTQYNQDNEEHPLFVKADANIKRFPYNRHIYQNIRCNATTNGEDVSAQIVSSDPLLRLRGNGKAKLRQNRKRISFDVEMLQVNPYALHYTNWSNLEGIAMEGNISGDIELRPGEWPLGQADIDSLILTSPTDTLCIDPIRLELEHNGRKWLGSAESPFLQIQASKDSAEICLPENEALARILRLPAYLSREATINAHWDSIAHRVSLEGDIPELVTSDGVVNALFKAEGSSKKHSPMPEDLHTSLAFDYITPKHLFSAAMVGDVRPNPLKIAVNSAEISLDGHPFTATDAILAEDENGTYTLDSLSLRNGDQELSIFGSASGKHDVMAFLHANDLQIDFFSDLIGKSFLNLGGFASGDVCLVSDSVLTVSTEDLKIRDFSYLGHLLGENTIDAIYDIDANNLLFDLDVDRQGHHSYVGGEAFLGDAERRSTIDLSLNLDSLPIDFLDHWVGGFLHELHGFGNGHARLYGRTDQLNLAGNPHLNANFTHRLLGAHFNINDTLQFVPADSTEVGHILLNHLLLTDRYGQSAYIEGDVKHHYLTSFDYDININIDESAKGFMVYDYPNQRPGDMYWGQIYANGSANLQGSTTKAQHQISVQMEPAGKSMLFLSPGEKNFSDNTYSFLKFQDKELLKEQSTDLDKLSHVRTLNNTIDNPKQETMVSADLQIHANQHCKVDMQLDPLAEDRLICTGSGDIALHYDSHNDIGLNGSYNISTGTYTITVKGDLMTKEFQLQNDSRVTFAGSPSDADLDLKAIYNIPSANLRDLDESFSTVANMSRTTVPIDCKLNVTGSLSSPQISFDLEVKNAGDDIQTLVHNIIGTPEMLNREVFYLLLFGRFYTPEYASTTSNNTAGGGLSSFASAALASQLNNLLGHISDNFSLGTSFYSDKGDFSDMEMDVNLQTRLFSDRLLLSGNLSYRDPASRIGMQGSNSNNAFIGDFDIEGLLNQAGTLRLKAYSHYNERYYNINNALTTQGIGIVMRKDFQSLKSLFGKSDKKAK